MLAGLLRREQRSARRAEQLDELGDERLGGERLDAAAGAAMKRREAGDSFAGLGRHLGRLDCERESGDEVHLAPAGKLDHARQMGLAQFDGRAGQSAHHRGGVLRIDEEPHPSQHVAYLGAFEKRAGLALGARERPAASVGSGIRYWHRPSIRAGYALGVDVIDWRVAQRIGERVAGSPPAGGVRASAVEPLAREFARKVSEYSGLATPTELPPLEAVDRSAWIAANLKSMRPLLAGLPERIGEGGGPLAGPLRAASGFLLGAQVGALTGLLSQRVLGQYDLALLDESVAPRLLLLAPNLAIAARGLRVDREQLVLWVTIHEITHAVQFSGAPWLRGHLGGMLKELIDGLQVSLLSRGEKDSNGKDDGEGPSGPSLLGSGGPGRGRLPKMPKLPDPAELRELLERARRGELLRITLGEDRWALVEQMQAVMSLIEGHAEHTMDAVGAEVLPSLPALRAAMNRRRESRGLPWRVLERLLGLEMKLRQYEIGRRFCDAVVEQGGPEALARVWTSAEHLPTTRELQEPAEWLARTASMGDSAARTHVPPVTN